MSTTTEESWHLNSGKKHKQNNRSSKIPFSLILLLAFLAVLSSHNEAYTTTTNDHAIATKKVFGSLCRRLEKRRLIKMISIFMNIFADILGFSCINTNRKISFFKVFAKFKKVQSKRAPPIRTFPLDWWLMLRKRKLTCSLCRLDLADCSQHLDVNRIVDRDHQAMGCSQDTALSWVPKERKNLLQTPWAHSLRRFSITFVFFFHLSMDICRHYSNNLFCMSPFLFHF